MKRSTRLFLLYFFSFNNFKRKNKSSHTVIINDNSNITTNNSTNTLINVYKQWK